MKHIAQRVVIAVSLIAAGWVLAKAQTSQPDFELIVNAPEGQTTVECVRGCEMAWVERGVNPNAKPIPTFSFTCRDPSARCSSRRIGGWISRP